MTWYQRAEPKSSKTTVSGVLTVALVLLSLVPVMFGLGVVYLACAVLGGAVFVWRSLALVRAPGRKAALQNFHASLLQLTLLLVGAMIDGWLIS